MKEDINRDELVEYLEAIFSEGPETFQNHRRTPAVRMPEWGSKNGLAKTKKLVPARNHITGDPLFGESFLANGIPNYNTIGEVM